MKQKTIITTVTSFLFFGLTALSQTCNERCYLELTLIHDSCERLKLYEFNGSGGNYWYGAFRIKTRRLTGSTIFTLELHDCWHGNEFMLFKFTTPEDTLHLIINGLDTLTPTSKMLVCAKVLVIEKRTYLYAHIKGDDTVNVSSVCEDYYKKVKRIIREKIETELKWFKKS